MRGLIADSIIVHSAAEEYRLVRQIIRVEHLPLFSLKKTFWRPGLGWLSAVKSSVPVAVSVLEVLACHLDDEQTTGSAACR